MTRFVSMIEDKEKLSQTPKICGNRLADRLVPYSLLQQDLHLFTRNITRAPSSCPDG